MILLDQCVPNKFQRIIQAWGYQVELLSQHLAIESSDQAVIELAQQLDAVLFTIDLDFANIVDYPPADYVGIMVMRYSVPEEADTLNSLQKALAELYREDLRHVLVIVEAQRYRIRKP